MKVLVVRVNKGKIIIGGDSVSSIARGIAVFVGIEKGDCPSTLTKMADKVSNLRMFEDESEKLNYSVNDKGFSILCIPNFTLCANTSKGRRPSFEHSMPYEGANKLFDDFVLLLESRGVNVETGIFGAYMNIALDLDGPINIILSSSLE